MKGIESKMLARDTGGTLCEVSVATTDDGISCVKALYVSKPDVARGKIIKKMFGLCVFEERIYLRTTTLTKLANESKRCFVELNTKK